MKTGYTAIVKELQLNVPSPFTESVIGGSARKSEVHSHRAVETYPKRFAHDGSLQSHLLFALKNEPTELLVLSAAFKKLGPGLVRTWVQGEPTGAYSRKAWFLYEFLTGQRIEDLPNAKAGAYTDVLNPKRHIVGARRTSSRHRVWDNLLGVSTFCPIVRKSQKLSTRLEQALDKEVATLTKAVDPGVLRRAVSYLYTKETRSTFEIEGEKANPRREERFVATLMEAAKFELSDKKALIALQNKIVDERYAASDWRAEQNYVGETASGYREIVHLITPKPEDVQGLMDAWIDFGRRVLAEGVDAVISAALLSFGFVFVHPFEDGNGRIHRFLIHSVLAKKGFTPEGVIFPISVAIVRDLSAYDDTLEKFSKPLLGLIEWRLLSEQAPEQRLEVSGDTADFYRYFDATPQAEYLYDRVAETIRTDLAEELDFLGAYDRAYKAVREVVDMPNKKVSLFVRLCMQNGGRFPKGKRKLFGELTDKEIEQMETSMRDAQNAHEVEAAQAAT